MPRARKLGPRLDRCTHARAHRPLHAARPPPQKTQGEIFAAEGYAKVTGRVGVCIATSGPGATNLVTGLADALLDSVPLVAITGQVPRKLIGTDGFQVRRGAGAGRQSGGGAHSDTDTHARTHTHTHTHAHTRTRTLAHTHTHVRTQAHAHTHKHAHKHTHKHAHPAPTRPRTPLPHPSQETPIVEVTRAITKHNYLVMHIRDLPRIIKEAFYLARCALGLGR